MNILQRWQSFYWDIDPGYINLKHAIRTLLAISLTIWLVRFEPGEIILMAGISCGFSMQGIVASSWRYRLLQVLLFDICYFCLFLLGLTIREHPTLCALVLASLGFTVNYLRRFGLEKSSAPMMAWLLCFLATILPFQEIRAAFVHIHGLIIGLSVSAVFTLFLFPENYARLYLNNSNRFFYLLSLGLAEIRQSLLKPEKKPKQFSQYRFVQCELRMRQLLSGNQILEQSPALGTEETALHPILLHQYALLNAYILLLEAYKTVWEAGIPISLSTRVAVIKLCRQFSQIFNKLRIQNNFLIRSGLRNYPVANFSQKLDKSFLKETPIVIALLNLKLSFDLMRLQLSKLSDLSGAG